MTYCIVNKVTTGHGCGYEQFIAIGIPDEWSARVMYAAISEYRSEGNTFSLEYGGYQLKVWENVPNPLPE